MPRKKTEKRSPKPDVCKPEWLELLRNMIYVRKFEEASEREFRKGKIGGYLHVYSGQEGVVAGIIPLLRKTDAVFAGYRDHAHALLLGSDPSAVMAELFGKRTGISKGKGGSMHLFDVANGLYGGYGIVGGHLPLAAGAAYAMRYQGRDDMVACFFGDGAMNIGSFHEALNMAGLWGKDGMCPALFVIENNGYAMGTSVERHSALPDLSQRVEAYAIPTEQLDGQDVVGFRERAVEIVAGIRKTGKPYCIEAMTYRYSGHGAADIQQPYRTKEEVEQHRLRDPIEIFTDRLMNDCGVTREKIDDIHAWAEEEVARAVEFAEASELPDEGELFRDIVAERG